MTKFQLNDRVLVIGPHRRYLSSYIKTVGVVLHVEGRGVWIKTRGMTHKTGLYFRDDELKPVPWASGSVWKALTNES